MEPAVKACSPAQRGELTARSFPDRYNIPDRATSRAIEWPASPANGQSTTRPSVANGSLCRTRDRFASTGQNAVWMTLSTVLEGVALTLLGDAEIGLSMTDKGIEMYQGITAPTMFWPLILLRGLVHSYSGHPDRGLALIDEAVALVGSDDFPDIGISRGDVMRLLPAPDLEGAERWYRDAIEAANGERLRTHELQALDPACRPDAGSGGKSRWER